MRDYSRPHATMTTRRQRVRPRPRWSNAVSLVAAACACAGAGEAAPVAAAPRVLGATIQDEAGIVLHEHDRRLREPLEGIDATAILRDIGQIDCPETVSKNIRLFLDANKIVVDACTEQTGYTLYPYGTKLPDEDQTSKICDSLNCMDLLTGVVLAKLPECEYQRYSPRSFAESFLRVRDDLLNGRRPPTAAEFGQLYALNRVVNYLTENTTIQASVKTNFKVNEVAAALSPVHVSKDVVLTDGFVVMVNTTTAADSSGSVHAAGNATTTKAPTSVMPAGGSNSSELTNSAGSTKDGNLPENLETAYLYTGLLWFFINVLYYWVMIRKGSDNY